MSVAVALFHVRIHFGRADPVAFTCTCLPSKRVALLSPAGTVVDTGASEDATVQRVNLLHTHAVRAHGASTANGQRRLSSQVIGLISAELRS